MSKSNRKAPIHRQIQSTKPKMNEEIIKQSTKEFFEQFLLEEEHNATINGFVYGDKKLDFGDHEHFKVDKNGKIVNTEHLNTLYPIRQAVRNRNKMIVITVTKDTDEYAYTFEDEESGTEIPTNYRDVRSWLIMGDSIKAQTAEELRAVYAMDSTTGDDIDLDQADRFCDAWELNTDWIK